MVTKVCETGQVCNCSRGNCLICGTCDRFARVRRTTRTCAYASLTVRDRSHGHPSFFATRKKMGEGFSGILKQVPERLVVDRVVELHLGPFDNGSEQPGAAVSGGFLQVRVTALHVRAE